MEDNKPINERWQEFQNKLNDTNFLKNVRTAIILLIVLGVPMLYFGFFGNITLEMLLNWKLGVLSVMVVGLLALIRIDTKTRAFDDEHTNNKNLQSVALEIDVESNKIKNHLLGHKFIAKYNKEQQALEDEIKTTKLLDDLSRRKAFLEIKGKHTTRKYKRLTQRITSLETQKAKGKYTPISYSDIYDSNEQRKNNKKGDHIKKTLGYNPKKTPVTTSLFGLITKGLTFGGIGTLPFMVGEQISTIIIFYVSFIVAIISTVLQNYIKTRIKTKTKYIRSCKLKLDILKDCNNYIAIEEESLELVRLEEEKNKLEKEKELMQQDIKELEQETNTYDILPELSAN